MLAVVMVLAMSITVFAEGDTTATHTITVTNTTQTGNHTYEAYQVFAGTYDSDSKQLEGLSWGSGVDSEALLTALKADTTIGSKFKDATTVAQVAAAVANLTESEVEAFASVVAKNLSSTKTTLTASKNDATTYTAKVADGYYLIKDKDGNTTAQKDAKTKYMLQVNGDVTVAAKSNTTTSEKKVDDKDDSTTTEDATSWQDSADYDIGDLVPFQLKATITEKYADYKAYKLVFHDKETSGLTFKADTVAVYVDGVKIESGYKVVTSNLADGDTFEVQFDDLKSITSVKAGSVITVEYQSELNTDAVIGSAGNPNTMHIEYSNNPNDEQDGETGTTPDDTVIIFTYKLDVSKVDEGGEKLSGATFSLWKKDLTVTDNDGFVKLRTIQGTNTSEFSFTGLDAGTYKLVEDVPPTGYNSIDPITFTITATHDILADDPALTALTTDNTKFKVEMTSGNVTNPTGRISADIENRSGSTLPSTGGIGTTIFYMVGIALMVAAAGLVMVRRRRA